MRSYGPWSCVGEREVVVGEQLHLLLGQRQLFVVTLQHRDAESPGLRRLVPRHVGEHADDEHGDDAGGRQHDRASLVRAQAEHEVEEEARQRDRHEAHQGHTTEARQRARRREVVQRHADVGPREAAEWRPTAQRFEDDPRRRGEERRRDPPAGEAGDDEPHECRRHRHRTDERDDRDQPEVPDPFEHHAVAADAECEAVERGVRRARVAPRPQQRTERDDDERTEIERREAEPRQDSGGESDAELGPVGAAPP